MSYRRTRAMFVKELHHITRDARSLGMALGVPVMMLLLYGYALSLDVDRIPTLIYDQDATAASRTLIRQFEGSRFFDIRGMVNLLVVGVSCAEGGERRGSASRLPRRRTTGMR